MTSTEPVIYSDDYTRLFAYQSRQFTIGDLSLRAINGVQWNAAVPAGGIAAATTAAAAAVLWAVGLSPWWSLLVLPVPALVVYVRLAKDRTGGLTETEKRRLAWNFRYRQPRTFLGVAADTERGDFTWDVIVWTPPHPMRRPS
jgi:hypothetical protein